MGSDNSKEFIPPDYPSRISPYNDIWVSEVRNATTANSSSIPFRRSEGCDQDSEFSFENLETLVDKVKNLYETTDTENHPAKLKALFACLGRVWAGWCVANAIISFYVSEKTNFDAISAQVEKKFTEFRARDSVIRLRNYVWEIERLTNRPDDCNLISNSLDQNVNFLMKELMVEGSVSALEEIYAHLEGGHRMKMESYILHILHVLFKGMNKNSEYLRQKYGRKGTEDYIRKQYSAESQEKVSGNICKILRRFDDELQTNLQRDFNEHFQRFDFLASKYDWLHLHLTENWSIVTSDYTSTYASSDFAPCVFKKNGEYYYWLHYIPKNIWIDPTAHEIATARQALSEANYDFKPHASRSVLMAKRLNQHKLAWWGIFYGDRNAAKFKFSNGCPIECSVMEWMDPYEWRVLLCGRPK